MKILIAGGKGQLGRDCTDILGKTYEVESVDIDEIDFSLYPDVDELLGHYRPDVVVNCAAFTQVDNCETQKELAWRANVTVPENLARSLRALGGRLIHISTDYVFDGLRPPPEPYVEEDQTNPLSYYAATKLASEESVRQTIEAHVIVRAAWMYGLNGHNFPKTMLRLALNNPEKEIKVVNDQYGSPTWSYRLALQIKELIKRNGRGTYHATAEGCCNWYELARFFLEAMNVPHKVIPCTSDQYPTPARRPKNSILENRHLKQENMNVMTFWQDDVKQFADNYRERLIEEAKR